MSQSQVLVLRPLSVNGADALGMVWKEPFRGPPADSGLEGRVPQKQMLLGFMWPHPDYTVVV